MWEHQILDFAYWCSCFGLWSIGATPSSFPKVHPPSWIWLFPEGQSKGWEAAAGYCQTMMVSHHCGSSKHPAANAVAVPQKRADHIHQNPSLQHPKYKLDRVPPLVTDPPQSTPSLEEERRRNLFATLHFWAPCYTLKKRRILYVLIRNIISSKFQHPGLNSINVWKVVEEDIYIATNNHWQSCFRKALATPGLVNSSAWPPSPLFQLI